VSFHLGVPLHWRDEEDARRAAEDHTAGDELVTDHVPREDTFSPEHLELAFVGEAFSEREGFAAAPAADALVRLVCEVVSW
jgi:hypothetical protein